MKAPLVSIVIPTHNRKKMLGRLLKSIFKSTYKNLEVIVIDDASSDGTYEFVKEKFKRAKIFKNKKNLFTAGSRNVGLKVSKGKYIFFIDDDNYLDKNSIKFLVAEMEKDDLIGEIGPVNYNFNKKNKILWFFTKRNMLTTKTYQPRNISMMGRKNTWETADIPNAFMVRADVIKKNKITFKEEFGIMYEESDFAYRIRNLGFKIVVVKNAKIFHDIEFTEKGKKAKDYMYHFMTDKRRPFVFARNRIIFHSLYSSRLEFLFILLFWNWFFAGYYIYKILFYSGIGNFSITKRLYLAIYYFWGCVAGVRYIL